MFRDPPSSTTTVSANRVLREGVCVALMLGVPVWDELDVPVVLEDGVSVRLELAVPVFEEDDVSVRLALAVPV